MGTCLAPCDKGQGKVAADGGMEVQTKDLNGQNAPSTGEVQVTQIPEPTVQEKQPGEKSFEATVAPGEAEETQDTLVAAKDGKESPRVLSAPTSPTSPRSPTSPAAATAQTPEGCVSADGKLVIGRSLPFRESSAPSGGSKTPSWAVSIGSEFKVRCGPNYSKNKQKAESLESLYDCLSVDMLYSDGIMRHIAKNLDWKSWLPIVLLDERRYVQVVNVVNHTYSLEGQILVTLSFLDESF
mmetsp:Transcript_9329/g.13178  ORF Transcript_9329/g.13178 Transcript_9329/m.13178 type:complete len:240 (+) Transcript_9329:109-828(+)